MSTPTPIRYLREIKSINDFKFITKVSRYVIELTCKDREPAEFWMTEKQFNKLTECFGIDPDNLDALPASAPRGRTVYAAFETGDTRERFIWPAERDPKWLIEKFGPFADEPSTEVDTEEEADM